MGSPGNRRSPQGAQSHLRADAPLLSLDVEAEPGSAMGDHPGRLFRQSCAFRPGEIERRAGAVALAVADPLRRVCVADLDGQSVVQPVASPQPIWTTCPVA